MSQIIMSSRIYPPCALLTTGATLLLAQMLVLPAVYMFNIFVALGGFIVDQSNTTIENYPLYPIYWDYLRPVTNVLPVLGMLGYFAVISFWTFIHRE